MKVRLALVAALFVTVLSAPAQTAEQWIARARARLGSEAALTGVKSIHYAGQLEIQGGATRKLDIVFQKPLQQRITLSGPESTEVIALDDYDAWQKRTNPKNPAQWQLTLLEPPQTRRLRAQTWDNLNFFSGVEKLRGTVKVDGEETVDGTPCVKLLFSYGGGMTLARYLDKTTARLVKTVTDAGTEIREEGEVFVNGIRFPRKVVNREKNGQVVTMTFEKVVVNESYPAADFTVPAMTPN